MCSKHSPNNVAWGALHPPVLLARVVTGLRKKLPSDAPKARTSSRRALDGVTGFLGSDGLGYSRWDWQAALPTQPASPGNEQGKEPSQAYRQSLPHHADATYVNLGTLSSSPERSRSAGDQGWTRGGALVVVGGWESQPHGEGRQ